MAELPVSTDSQTEQVHCHGVCQKLRQHLRDCQQRKEFCDVILETEGGDRVCAHKVIVASGSQVLHSMLVDTINVKDEGSGMQILRLPGVNEESLHDLVRFVYLGNVERISMNTVSLWEHFQISEPIRLCEQSATLKVPEPETTSVSYIKSEDESSQGYELCAEIDKIDKNRESNNEEGTEPPSPKTLEESDNSDQCANRKRKRKCTSPLKKQDGYSSKEDSLTEDDDIDYQPERNRRASTRLKRKVVTKPKIKTEGVICKTVPKKRRGKVTVETPVNNQKQKKTCGKNFEKSLCKTCNIHFDTVHLYREHREAMHKNRHKCFECGATFNRGNRLKAHRVANHFKEGLPQPTWHYCKAVDCSYKSVYTDVLEQHYKSVHVKEKVICETCGASFTQQYYLSLHIKRVHDGIGPTYQCGECDTSCYTARQLKIHTDRVHKKNLNFLCDQCTFMGFDKQSIDFHMFNKHGVPLPGARPTYSCPHCDYKSITKSILKAHIERHEEKDYKCDQCDSVFRCNRDLKGHRRLRHSNRPKVVHQCPYEGCKYASIYGPSALKNHISRMHERKDFKPWACEVCDYRTNVKGNLHLHLRKVHSLHPQILQHRVTKLPPPESESISDAQSAKQENHQTPPITVPQNFHGCLPETYQLVSLTETVTTPQIVPATSPQIVPVTSPQLAPVISPQILPMTSPQILPVASQIAPTYPSTSVPVQMPRLPPNVPIMPGTQYGLPPVGYTENIFMQGL